MEPKIPNQSCSVSHSWGQFVTFSIVQVDLLLLSATMLARLPPWRTGTAVLTAGPYSAFSHH